MPATPTGLQAVNVPDISVQTNIVTNDVDITWNPVSSATGYNLIDCIWNSSTHSWGQWNTIATGNNYSAYNQRNGQTQVGYDLYNQPTGEVLEFSVCATNSVGASQSSQPVEITVTSSNSSTPTGLLTLANVTLPNCTAVQPYSYSFTATGGAPPYIYQITQGSLPSGLSLSNDGAISGTSTATPGSYTFTVGVTDSSGNTSSNTFTITVNSSTITLSPISSPLQLSEPNTYSWNYNGQRFSWSVSVPIPLLENEAFSQVPEIVKLENNYSHFWASLLHGDLSPQQVFNNLVDDSGSSGYIGGIATELNQVAQSEGYDQFHEAEFIAGFVQVIPYHIINNNAEFPPQVIANGGDCINKSILLVSILHHLGYPVAVFILPSLNHAVAGIGFTANQIPQGRTALTTYTKGGVTYYFTETTATANIGVSSMWGTNLGTVIIYPIQ